MNKVIFELTKLIPDSLYIRMMYFKHFHRLPELKNPQSYNEKLQWIKFNDKNPRYIKMVDKIKAKEYVASIIGEKYIIPTLGMWDSADEINLEELPDQFVLKCNHDSKSVAICIDKNTFDFEAAKAMLNSRLKRNGYWYGREWPYKKVKPRILAEKYLNNESNTSLEDYKVMCFNGKAKLIELHQGRNTSQHTQDFYDTEWKKTTISQKGSMSNNIFPKPNCLNEMLVLSELLARDIYHVRIDWYEVSGKLYFGEITFFDGSGFVPFDDQRDDLVLGSWIDLIHK